MPRRLVIAGAGGLAREMAWVVRQIDPRSQDWELAGFVAPAAADTKGLPAPVLGDDDWLIAQDDEADVLVAVGQPEGRRRVAEKLTQQQRLRFPNLVHPSAVCGDPSIGWGIGNTVQAACIMTVNIRVGDFNLINGATTVGHDAVIGDYNVLNPCNISGGVQIGDRVLVGTGAVILEDCRIGDGAIVGAGAVVRSDVEPGQVMIGVPAKPMQPRTS